MKKEHREKISKSHIGKDISLETKTKISESTKYGNSHRCNLWTILSPTGRIYITKDVRTICSEFNLSYNSLRQKGQTKDIRPIEYGPSKGWSVLKYEKPSELLKLNK